MSSGGARSHSGPGADPNALRRNRPGDSAEWRHLPATGREGEPPPWPLTRASAREKVLWAEEWRRPQAIAWEEIGLVREVGLYVRALRIAESPRAFVAARTLLARLQDALGLSVAGLRANRWIIDERRDASYLATGTETPSVRSRWKVLDGGS